MIDDNNTEIRGSGVKRDVGRDEKQLIKFVWPNAFEGWIHLEIQTSKSEASTLNGGLFSNVLLLNHQYLGH